MTFAPADPTDPTQSKAFRVKLLAGLFLVQAFNLADRQVLSVLLPQIKRDLLLADWQLGMLGGIAFALFYSLAGLPIAKLADRSHRINIVTITLGLWSLMTAVCGLATNFLQLLIARVGVGVGEAGSGPASGSIVSDVYTAERRSSATAVYNAGAPFGTAVGLLVGGLLAELYGWRNAFFYLGGTGVLFAVLFRLLMREPPRSKGTESSPAIERATIAQVFKLVSKRPTFLHLAIGAALSGFYSYGVALWIPSYLHRSFGLGLADIGMWLAIMYLTSGSLSILVGGFLADRLARRDPRWRMWFSAIGMFASLPFAAFAFLAPSAFWAITGLFAMMFFVNYWLGPTTATILGLVGARMRAVALSIFALLLNLIGLGLGPVILGAISDGLQSWSGNQALRHALLISVVFKAWSGLHYVLAARTLERDLARAPA